ncbi:MAG: hypothetical protein L6R41_006093 [Letrouitia leprolyta]|nr:MAG: hypothetical protein L6R41_006093 [Letrouitia leprolyta]
MDQATIAERLVSLTGVARDYFDRLYIMADESDDIEIYIRKAYDERRITQSQANIATLVLMTGLEPDVCGDLLLPAQNVLQALDAAREGGCINQEQATICRLAIATGKTSTKARKYLVETIPPFDTSQAMKYMLDAREITTKEYTMAMFRFATSLGQVAALKYLNHDMVQGNVIKAINLAFQKQDLSRQEHFVAHLIYRFVRTEEQAEATAKRVDVRWDLGKGVHVTKCAIIMEQAFVDSLDANKLLTKYGGDVNQALQAALMEAQADKFLFNGDSGDTRHPPNVTANTHVIAVLGVADGGSHNRASPSEDGWMVSDFYLWKHVLRGMGKSQQWLTCEDPSQLLQKYGRSDKWVKTDQKPIGGAKNEQVSWKEGYIHGDPFEERVIVLNQSLLPTAKQELTITRPGITLRNEFLRRVEVVCNEAQRNNDPVLLMIFSHGDVDTAELGGLVIGIDPDTPDTNDFLSPRLFATTYLKTPKVRMSLFMSSCFSGHWVVTPRLNIRRPTIMAGARPNEETFAWALSASQRHAGGVYTSAFLHELLQEPIMIPATADAHSVRKYADLTRDIVAEANRLCIPARMETAGGSLPIFTTEGGSDRFYERTHLQLYKYRENFEQLPRIPASDPHPYSDKKRDLQPNDPEVEAWNKRHPEVSLPEYSDRTGSYGTTRRGIRRSTHFLAHRYMSSLPGDDSSSKNIHLHKMIRQFKAGMLNHNMAAIEDLRRQLLYRLWMTQRANQYAQTLNLNKLPSIERWDGRIPGDQAIQNRFDVNWAIIQEANVFARPDAGTGWGHFYGKPIRYLAVAFALSNYQADEVKKLISIVQNSIKASTRGKVTTVLGSKRCIGSISQFKSMMQPKSPRKRHRSSLASTGWMESDQGHGNQRNFAVVEN